MQSRPRRSSPALFVLSTHPGPSFAVALVCVVLGITTGLEPWRVALIGLAILLGQFSVGLANDWLDADRDRQTGRTDKPVALGWISVPAVRAASFGTGILGLAVTIALGWPATVAHAGFIASGWAYNLWLKRTPLSVLPYLVGFGTLPAVVTLAKTTPAFPELWIVGAGAFLGAAAHFANALPDLDDDRMTGVVGLPHRIGVRASGIATFGALAAASTLVVFGPFLFGPLFFGPAALGSGRPPGLVAWIALGIETGIVIAGIVLVVTRPPARPLFRLVILGALVAVAALALSGSQLTAS